MCDAPFCVARGHNPRVVECIGQTRLGAPRGARAHTFSQSSRFCNRSDPALLRRSSCARATRAHLNACLGCARAPDRHPWACSDPKLLDFQRYSPSHVRNSKAWLGNRRSFRRHGAPASLPKRTSQSQRLLRPCRPARSFLGQRASELRFAGRRRSFCQARARQGSCAEAHVPRDARSRREGAPGLPPARRRCRRIPRSGCGSVPRARAVGRRVARRLAAAPPVAWPLLRAMPVSG